jgi:hypothetical protein
MASQLEDDLSNRLKERLQKWVQDSEALFDMAGIDPRKARIEMIEHLMVAATVLIVATTKKTTDGEFAAAFGRLLAEGREQWERS